jgi:hypothetical protein
MRQNQKTNYTILGLILFGTLIFSSCGKPKKEKTDLEESELSGEVREADVLEFSLSKESINQLELVSQTKSLFSPKGYLYEIYKYDKNRKFSTANSILRNSNGKVISTLNRSYFGIFLKTETDYDETGNVIKETDYGGNFKEDEISGNRMFYYDEKKQETKNVTRGLDGKVQSKAVFKYDSEGNKIYNAFFLDENTISSYYKTAYNSNGDKISESKFGRNDKFEETKYFNTNGSLKRTRFLQDVSGDSIDVLYVYNENDLVIQHLYCSKTDTLVKIIFEYNFDSKGNWIERVQKKNGLVQSRTERRLEYYNADEIKTFSKNDHKEYKEGIIAQWAIDNLCNKDAVEDNFKSWMKFTYPKWKIVSDITIQESDDCEYRIQCSLRDPHMAKLGVWENEVCIFDFQYKENYDKYLVTRTKGTIY